MKAYQKIKNIGKIALCSVLSVLASGIPYFLPVSQSYAQNSNIINPAPIIKPLEKAPMPPLEDLAYEEENSGLEFRLLKLPEFELKLNLDYKTESETIDSKIQNVDSSNRVKSGYDASMISNSNLNLLDYYSVKLYKDRFEYGSGFHGVDLNAIGHGFEPSSKGRRFELSPGTVGLDFKGVAAIVAAYMTHLSLHEIGHHVVAEDVGADSPRIHFFTAKHGRLYPGLSTYKSIPHKSKLPYAVGGERMAGYTLEYALQSYHLKPTTFNKALMFFGCADFLAYTLLALLANYVYPENDMYDPNLIRQETGLSKEALLSLVMAKSLMNTYRVFNENANFAPFIWVDKDSAAFMIRFEFR